MYIFYHVFPGNQTNDFGNALEYSAENYNGVSIYTNVTLAAACVAAEK